MVAVSALYVTYALKLNRSKQSLSTSLVRSGKKLVDACALEKAEFWPRVRPIYEYLIMKSFQYRQLD